MKRSKSLVRKYLWINMSVISVGFIILALITLLFIMNYWKNEKSETYLKDANYIADMVSNNSTVEDGNLVWINGDSVKMFMDTLSLDTDVDILIADRSGKVVLCSGEQIYEKQVYSKAKISNSIIDQIGYNKGLSLSNLGGLYDSLRYMVRVPIYVLIGGTKTIIGSVFITMDARLLNNLKNDLFKIFFVVFIVALFISFWAIRKISYDVVRPLRQMCEAEKCIANGDFSRRVYVKGDDEIAELALSFNDMASSLEASENVRKSFIANVSHEFKTPMTTISGFINGILDGIIAKEKEDKYLMIILSEIKRLSGLVKMMLDLSRIDSENIKMTYSKFQVKDVIINILISFEDIIQKKNIEIKGLNNPNFTYIYADRDMIYQVIYNLIENAVKFTNYSGYIHIGFKEDGKSNILTIKNSGKGISNSEIKFVFDRFYKTDKSRSEDKSGFGLGLYIVKRIVSLHRGSIKAWSEPGEFTRFELAIPRY